MQLEIRQTEKQPLSQKQIQFNKLIADIEKLKQKLQDQEVQLAEARSIYQNKLYPLEKEINFLRMEIVLVFKKHHQELKWKKKEEDMLREVVGMHLMNFPLEFIDEHPELKSAVEYFNKLNKKNAKDQKMVLGFIKDQLENQLESMEVNFDREVLRALESEEEIQKFMDELKGRIEEAQETFASKGTDFKKTSTKNKKSKKDDSVDSEELNLSKIYKSLAKIFHPDLEIDPEKKIQKHHLMQSLTNAYKNGDITMLLMLELEWVKESKKDLEELSERQLTSYIKVLREQVTSLRSQVTEQIHSSKNRYFIRYFSGGKKLINEKRHVSELNLEVHTLKIHLEQIKDPKDVKYVISDAHEELNAFAFY